jgi:hypothetical protein
MARTTSQTSGTATRTPTTPSPATDPAAMFAALGITPEKLAAALASMTGQTAPAAMPAQRTRAAKPAPADAPVDLPAEIVAQLIANALADGVLRPGGSETTGSRGYRCSITVGAKPSRYQVNITATLHGTVRADVAAARRAARAQS